MELLTFIIDESLSGERIDKALTSLIKDVSRSKIASLIEDENILVNDNFVSPSYKLKLNDKVTVDVVFEDKDIEPENIPLDIVYEDDDLLIINKEAGMVVHPANGHYSHTLVNALMYHFKNNLSSVNGSARPGIVHRLDKETSGLIMVAKTDKAHNDIASQLKDKTAYRKYVALLDGVLPHEQGKIDAPIGRDANDRIKMAVNFSGKPAVTHYKVLERFTHYTLVECLLETGRTHQIRVHFAKLGYPVVGDVIYGPKKTKYDKQLLHAKALGLISPSRKEKIYVEIDLPSYFKEALDNLRNYDKLKKGE